MLGAVHIDVVDAGQKPAGENALAQFGIVEEMVIGGSLPP
jgi:hypothetical protein